MTVAILFITCLLLVIGSIFYGKRVIRIERSDAVFGDPERAKGGWYWIVAGISTLLVVWFYFSWDAARSFFPNAANELCQVAKVSYAIRPIHSIFPIESRLLKGTYMLDREHVQINRLEKEIQKAGFDAREKAELQNLIAGLRTTLTILVSPEYTTPETAAKLSKVSADIDKLVTEFSSPGYPGAATAEELAAANAQPAWGEVGIEIPILPETARGRKFDAASKVIKTISDDFVRIRNKSPQFNEQVVNLKTQIKKFRLYNNSVIALDESTIESRKRLVKRINQVFMRADDATIFPPAALNAVETSLRRFDSEQLTQQGGLRYIGSFAMAGGSILASTHSCSEQGSGRWLPKPADTVRNFIRILDPDVGYKNVPMLWYKEISLGELIAPLIPDWIADLVPGDYPRHTASGEIPKNFKTRVLNFATGNYISPMIPVPTGHIWDSLVRVFMGLFLGIIFGVPLGIFMGLSRFAKGFFDPMIELYRPVPPLAWAPLILTIFGIGDPGKIFLLFMVAFAIMVISARVGARGTQLSKIHAAHSLGASNWQITKEVILPNSLPEILTGIRVAVGVCWGTLVAAEFLAGTTGIGFVENVARKQSHYEIIWVTIVILGVLGLIMDIIMRRIIKRTIPWRGKG
ncbi:MAG: ABC transporter permease [Sedimenticola sp.]